MYARVSTFEGPAGLSEEEINAITSELKAGVLPKIRAMYGFKGLISLLDNDTGKAIAVTLWDSEEAMSASEADANAVREQAAEIEQSEIRGVEHYRVTLYEPA